MVKRDGIIGRYNFVAINATQRGDFNLSNSCTAWQSLTIPSSFSSNR